MEPFISMILLWPGNFAPRGWAFCQGQLLSIAQNQTLFSLLGNSYGGDGVSTFALPDLQGRVPVGAGVYPGIPEYRLGAQGGTPVQELTIDQMPKHNHTISADNVSVTVGVDAANTANQHTPGPNTVLGQAVTLDAVNNQVKTYSDQAPTTTLGGVGFGGTFDVGYAGNGAGFDNFPPYQVINYIIALDGIYPSRS